MRETPQRERTGRTSRPDRTNDSKKDQGTPRRTPPRDNRRSPGEERPARSQRSSETDPRVGTLSEDGMVWKQDPRTGVVYKQLPKAEYDAEGRPILHVGESDMPDALNDMNSAADLFLGHLRVTPSPEEMKRLRKEHADRARRASQQYANENAEEIRKVREQEEKAQEGMY